MEAVKYYLYRKICDYLYSFALVYHWLEANCDVLIMNNFQWLTFLSFLFVFLGDVYLSSELENSALNGTTLVFDINCPQLQNIHTYDT